MFHEKCTNLSKAVFEHCREDSSTIWFCSSCETPCKRLFGDVGILRERIEKIEEVMKKQEEKMEDNETKINKLNKKVEDMAEDKQEYMEEVLEELAMKHQKRKDIVIYGLEDTEEKNDQEQVSELLDCIGLSLDNYELKTVVRMGKQDRKNPTRPLLVKFHEDRAKEDILGNAHKLAGKVAWKKVSIKPNQTKREREIELKRMNQMKKTRELCIGSGLKFKLQGHGELSRVRRFY